MKFVLAKAGCKSVGKGYKLTAPDGKVFELDLAPSQDYRQDFFEDYLECMGREIFVVNLITLLQKLPPRHKVIICERERWGLLIMGDDAEESFIELNMIEEE